MSIAIIAVLGTLAGALIGSAITHFTQVAAFRREASERQVNLRREAYLDWLAEVSILSKVLRDAHRRFLHQIRDQEGLQADLRGASSTGLQKAQERLRLVAPSGVLAASSPLTYHLRKEDLPSVGVSSGGEYRAWVSELWRLRRLFIEQARRDVGSSDIDWTTAGVGEGVYAPFESNKTRREEHSGQ